MRRGPVEQLGVLATLSRWRPRVQIPSGPPSAFDPATASAVRRAARPRRDHVAYRYAIERRDHSDLAGGNVLRSAPGHPGFPVRLADELFQRADAHLSAVPLTLWDPCCGSGHLAATAGILHRHRLRRLLATDTDPAALSIAERNLALLSPSGMAERERELRAGAAEFAKPAMLERARAAARLAERLSGYGDGLDYVVRAGDVFHPEPPEHP